MPDPTLLQVGPLRALIESRLDALLPAPDQAPEKLHEAMRYSALAPGKRLRPLLCLASAAASGGEWESALDGACALEFIHCFSLIHDDLPAIDNDDLRRGRPTCHKVYGEAMAILAGDALFALAFDCAAGDGSRPAAQARAVKVLAQATGTPGLVAGEVLDILSERTEPDLDLVRRIHEWKTGSLIAASCQLGAILGGGAEGTEEELRGFGMAVGLAFQIQDDILNETSTPEQLGKAVGSDKDHGKQTYPALMGLEASREEAARLIEKAQGHLARLPGDTALLEELALFSAQRKV